jgi:hypothetical protein
MKTALEKGKELPPYKMAYSSRTVVRLQRFLPLFEHSIQLQRQSMASQSKKSKDYNEALKKAKIYLTHFIKVMNMAICRGDLPTEIRAFYGLTTNELTLPSLNTENELISWGRRIIEGEEFRLRKGGSPITNPTIAVVKVRFENFLDADNFHRTLVKKTLDYTERTADMRKEADEIILQIWNEVEASLSTTPEDLRQKESEEYGLVYFYRKNELIKQAVPQLQAIVLPQVQETALPAVQNSALPAVQDSTLPAVQDSALTSELATI